MSDYLLDIVDVFAEKPLAGNQLAIVRNASDLSAEQMQAIALETNYSETTFVIGQQKDIAKVRIFTPEYELDFAGHPVLGTAWLLAGGSGNITLDLPVGHVPVHFEAGISWLKPPEPKFLSTLTNQQAAVLISLDETQINDTLPVVVGNIGIQFVIIAVTSLKTLQSISVNLAYRQQLLDTGLDVSKIFVVSNESYDDADYAARMIFNANGLREDAATGSANSLFAYYLQKYKGNIGRVIVDQGYEINRPSRIYLDIADNLRVGGKVMPFACGKLSL